MVCDRDYGPVVLVDLGDGVRGGGLEECSSFGWVWADERSRREIERR